MTVLLTPNPNQGFHNVGLLGHSYYADDQRELVVEDPGDELILLSHGCVAKPASAPAAAVAMSFATRVGTPVPAPASPSAKAEEDGGDKEE